MCKSLKGAAYFGSTVHVVAAFVFFFWFLFDTVISEMHINLLRCIQSDTDAIHNQLVHYLNLPFKLLYYVSMCITGIYIFRGVERNAPRVIKIALLVFVIVQIVGLILFVVVQVNYWEEHKHDNKDLSNAAQLRKTRDLIIHQDEDEGEYGDGEGIIVDEDQQKVYEYYSSSNEEQNDGSSYIDIKVFSHLPPTDDSPPPFDQLMFDDVGDEATNDDGESNIEPIWQIDKSPEAPPTAENLVLRPSPPVRSSDNSDSSESSTILTRVLQSEEQELTRRPLPLSAQNMVLADAHLNTTIQPIQEDEAVLEIPVVMITTTSMSPTVEDHPPDIVYPKSNETKGRVQLSQNQLVNIVFQVFLAGANAVGSCIYTGVLLVHLTSL